jgi:ATP-dependent DNA helicase RecQ
MRLDARGAMAQALGLDFMDELRALLRENFGHESLRSGQAEVIGPLMAGRPVLAVFPTGGGKSLCYQLPALALEGLTLVISPLIALMKDQVESLTRRGIAAARLDSTMDAEGLRALYEDLDAGRLRMLYIAPERLANERFRERVRRWNVAMVAVDEAHCISEWGHNFRPDYLKIARFCRRLKVARVLALTATATPKVATDIRRAFRIAKEDHVALGFHRPNLDLRVTPCTAAERKALLLERLASIDGAAVVYVTRQETAEEVATFLKSQELAASAYHAGLPDDFRAASQAAFMSGETRVIVATIAFGMGIDKSDIRAVIHYNMPKSLENHAQEIGRAGRDGMPAHCECFVCADDLTVLENFIYSDTPGIGALENLVHRILGLGASFDISVYDLAATCDIRNSVIATVIAYLENDGIVEATGSHYHTYKLRFLRDLNRVLAGRAKNESRFLGDLIGRGKAARSWTTFEPSVLCVEMGVSREKIVAALQELELAGDAELAVSGVRQAFRMKSDPGDLKALAKRYATMFADRENADLARLSQVMGLASRKDCLTAFIAAYFGEKMSEPCGHCDRCRGVPAAKIRRSSTRVPDDREWAELRAVVDEKHAALGTPRQLARFLCGMSSPASTRARLGRHDSFGMLADLPFSEVLTVANAVLPEARKAES